MCRRKWRWALGGSVTSAQKGGGQEKNRLSLNSLSLGDFGMRTRRRQRIAKSFGAPGLDRPACGIGCVRERVFRARIGRGRQPKGQSQFRRFFAGEARSFHDQNLSLQFKLLGSLGDSAKIRLHSEKHENGA